MYKVESENQIYQAKYLKPNTKHNCYPFNQTCKTEYTQPILTNQTLRNLIYKKLK